ncbi:hypothetical protein T10_2334 [Trichinella papuae]|uniref:Uncharacterized protein n=1 Tax=Trichinella papuae TaxID=268474 RepID=A0A0V1MQ21_9BILA|nr:hypothetical protein T10_2334 [Trichinella papuae]
MAASYIFQASFRVLELPYQPAVEYEQADVSTANCNKTFLIFIINKIFCKKYIRIAVDLKYQYGISELRQWRISEINYTNLHRTRVAPLS